MAHLAKPGDPLVANGKVIAHEDEADNLKKGERFVPLIRRTKINNVRNIKEIPCAQDPSYQTAINAVLVYHLIGLSENETAHLLRIPFEEVQNIRHSSDYQVTFEMVFSELISASSNSIRAKLADYSTKAVDQIIELAENADKDIVKLKANQDILDRAGFSPENIFGDSQGDDDDLKIIIDNGAAGGGTVNINIKGKR